MPEKYELQYVIKGDASGMRSANSELQKFDKNISKIGAGKQLTGLASSLSGVATGSQLNGLTSQLTSASGALSALPGPAGLAAGAIALLGVGAVSAGVALYGLAKSASDYGSEIYDASVTTGLGAESLTSLRLAASQTSASFDDVITGVSKFEKTIANAALGSEEASASLQRLGIKPQDAIKDLDGALAQVFKKINSLPDPISRTKAATDAFGKAGANKMLMVIDQMNGDLPKFIEYCKKLGLTLTNEDIKAADEFGDQMKELEAQLKMVQVRFGQELMPVFLKASQDISSWLVENQGEIKDWAIATKDAVSDVIDVLKGLRGAWEFLRDPAMYGARLITGTRAPTTQTPAQWGISEYEAQQSLQGGRRPPIDPDYLADLEKKKDAAEKARKEALERAKRNNAAMIAIEQIYIKDVEAIYQDSIASAERNLSEGGRITDYKAEILEANAYLKKQTEKSYGEIAALENIAAEQDQKTAQEKEALRQQQADRLSQIEIKTGKATLEAQEKADKEFQKRQNDGYAIATANIAAQYDLRQANLDLAHETALMSELQYQQARNKLVLEELDKELQAMILAGKSKDEIALQELKIQAAKVRAQQAERQAEKKDFEARKKEIDELTEAGEKLARSFRDAATAWAEAQVADRARRTVGSSSAISSMEGLREHFVGEQNTAAIAGIDALAGAFDGLGQAIGTAVEAWVLYGNAGQSVRQVTAQILAGIAQQAAVKAIFELAEGFAALAMAFFGVPNAGPSATAHFTAAAVYGSIAGVAALAGRAVAGNSFNQSGTSGSSSGSSASSGAASNAPPHTYTRTSEDAYLSGNRGNEALAAEVRRLSDKISAMRPGDVLTAGIRQKPGTILKAAANDAGTNFQDAKRLAKRTGLR